MKVKVIHGLQNAKYLRKKKKKILVVKQHNVVGMFAVFIKKLIRNGKLQGGLVNIIVVNLAVVTRTQI